MGCPENIFGHLFGHAGQTWVQALGGEFGLNDRDCHGDGVFVDNPVTHDFTRDGVAG